MAIVDRTTGSGLVLLISLLASDYSMESLPVVFACCTT